MLFMLFFILFNQYLFFNDFRSTKMLTLEKIIIINKQK